jgi:hypothetical protein
VECFLQVLDLGRLTPRGWTWRRPRQPEVCNKISEFRQLISLLFPEQKGQSEVFPLYKYLRKGKKCRIGPGIVKDPQMFWQSQIHTEMQSK